LCLLTTGCECSFRSIKQRVGIASAPEITPEEEHQNRLDALRRADELVSRTVDSLTGDGAFTRPQGFVEPDPWGGQLRFTFSQEWTTAKADVRSAGPDGLFDTTDDVVRTADRPNAIGVVWVLPWFAYVLAVWALASVLAIVVMAPQKRNAVNVVFALPAAVLVCVGAIIEAIGDLFSGDGGA